MMKDAATENAGRIMVALDYPDAGAAERLLTELQGIPCYMKVGMQLFYAAGPSFVDTLKQRGYKVFLDLKLHDIPNTVKGGSESIARLGVDMFNVHAAGGSAMMEAALEGVDKGLASRQAASRPLVIAVTQLTSTSQAVLNGQIGIAGSVEAAVLRYAELAKQAGLDGVVASALEVAPIKQACGAGFVAVTPGIRPQGADAGDQARVLTPREAIAQGSDYLVIGRPITAAADPRQALESIIEELC
ncbi:MAG: orotidine 5-phosphate decarboxylase [Paenibacillaceae bacterium]|jgi:orotidine-5'-phosphate decarboxylase|nr:orotidine 5-phosphate decarboxylase [Paenibacillaceae bacterium]